MLMLERERERRGMRVKDFREKRECVEIERKKREKGRGKHINEFKV
jgi:hypothetical protein